MKKVLFIAIVGVLMATSAAMAQDVRYNFDKNTDFSRFKTYEWVILKDATKLDNLADQQVKDAVDVQLAAKGLTKVDSDSADLYVGYQAAVGQEKEFTSYNTGWGYGGGWYGGGWYGSGMGSGTTYASTTTIYVGQLALDMYDSANKDLVWRGVVSKTLDTEAKPEKRQKNLTKAMKKLFKNYPPVKK